MCSATKAYICISAGTTTLRELPMSAPSITEQFPEAWAELQEALDVYTKSLRAEVGRHFDDSARMDGSKLDVLMRRMDALAGRGVAGGSWEEGKHPRKGGGPGGGQFTAGAGGGAPAGKPVGSATQRPAVAPKAGAAMPKGRP